MGGRGGAANNLNSSRPPPKVRLAGPVALFTSPGGGCCPVTGRVSQLCFALVCACTPSRGAEGTNTASPTLVRASL